ncbi:MAG: response regulator [Desulfobacterota bacterium]|nr:response regulator [Thermodesulfobacteriota bacterium]
MKTALIVDDDEQNLYLLKTLLESNDFCVVLAHNGAEALEIARRSPPDIAISDILMPMMDGFSLLREWNREERLRKIPVIIYTATYTDPADQKLAVSLGAARFIIKPAEPELFIAELKQVMAAYAAGSITATVEHFEDNQEYYRMYNEALIRKLEKKMLDLEQEKEQRRCSEEQVQRLAHEWQETFDAIEDGICLIDAQQRIVRHNKAFVRFVAKPDHGIIGRRCWQVVHGTDEALPDCPVLKAAKSLRRESLELDLRDKILLVTVDPILDRNGTMQSAVHIIRDITELRKSERSLRLKLDELQRWHKVVLNREDRIIELKKEVNELRKEAGKPLRYGPDGEA